MDAALRWLADTLRPPPNCCGCWMAPRCLWPLADHRQAFQPCRLGRLRPRHLHPCCYWGSRLLLLTTPDGTVTGFGLANPKQLGERQAVVAMLGGWRPTGRHLARCWWATRALPAATSRPPWPSWSLAWCARPAPTSPMLASSPTGCDSGSRRSSGPSSTSWVWTVTAAASRPGCGRGWCSACSPQRRHLVQLADRRPDQALPGRLRPLTLPLPASKTTSTI